MQPGQRYLTTGDGVRLFFQQIGSGPKPVVIPNGFHMVDDFQCLSEDRTLIVYDLRNRGWSDHVSDPSKLARGIHNDVDDLETVRHHFGISQVDLIGHSYLGLMVILYAMKYPACVNRVVQIGPMQPHAGKQYPAHLTCADGTLTEVFSKLGELQKERESTDPVEFCKKFWDILRVIYVSSPADADKINWGRCELVNERNMMRYWNESVFPSIKELKFEDVSKAQAPVLTIHGMKDRSAPYGGGREWAMMLPDARLLSVAKAGHAPWVEAPELVFGSIQEFLGGRWPEEAEKVMSMDL
jgi:pimeloyl-ACP methyl ester carboxylesterase